MKKKLLIATATLGLIGSMVTTNVQAAAKTVKKNSVKTHTAAKTSTAKKVTVKKKKISRVTHSMRRVAVNSPNAPLITE
jgi:peptidoglycan hydrolase CwlO-like protein